MLVLDASIYLHFFIQNPHQELASKVFKHILKGSEKAFSPEFVLAEITNVLAKPVNSLNDEQISVYLSLIEKMVATGSLELVSVNFELIRAAARLATWDIPNGQGRISGYDALYHALALQLGCRFLTADRRHYNKTHSTLGNVVLLDEYLV